MVWIIGEYAERIENADELLDMFIETFEEETMPVKLAILTAMVKLFLKRPHDTQVSCRLVLLAGSSPASISQCKGQTEKLKFWTFYRRHLIWSQYFWRLHFPTMALYVFCDQSQKITPPRPGPPQLAPTITGLRQWPLQKMGGGDLLCLPVLHIYYCVYLHCKFIVTAGICIFASISTVPSSGGSDSGSDNDRSSSGTCSKTILSL